MMVDPVTAQAAIPARQVELAPAMPQQAGQDAAADFAASLKVAATEHIGGTDMLLYSTDYPHRQFTGSDPLPAGLPEEALPDILSGNALKAYPRLAAEPALREAAAILEETT